MTDKVGGVEYELKADASKLLDSGAKVTGLTRKMANDFKRVDDQLTAFESKQKSVGRTIDAQGRVFFKNGNEAKTLSSKYQEMIASIRALEQENNNAITGLSAFESAIRRSGNAIDAQGQVIDSAGNEVKDLTASYQSLKNASGTVDVATKQLADELVDFELRVRQSGKTINAQGLVLNKNGSQAKQLSKEYQRLTASMASLESQANRTRGAAGKASGALGAVGSRAGQASMQVQQFVGQVQGGQSALLALSQQAADLGFVLGVPLAGALVGIGASAVAMGAQFFKTGEDTETLTEKLQELAKTQLLTAEQAEYLRKQEAASVKEREAEIRRLEKAIESENASMKASDEAVLANVNAKNKNARITKEQANEILNAAGRHKEQKDEIERLRIQIQLANDAIESHNKKQEKLAFAAQFGAKQTEEQVDAISSVISRLKEEQEEIGRNAAQLLVLRMQRMNATGAEIAQALAIQQNITARKEQLKLENQSASDAERAQKLETQVLEGLRAKKLALEENAVAQAEYNVRRRLGLEDQEKIPEAIQAEIDALELLRQKREEQSEQEKQTQEIEQKFTTLQQGLPTDQNPLEQLAEQQAQERALIQEHLALKLQDENLSLEQRRAMAEEHGSMLTAIEKKYADARLNIAQVEEAQKKAAISRGLNNIASLMNTGSKKLFKIGQVAAAANATIDGIQAVQKARAAAPPPLNYALAATEALAAAVNVKKIMSQKVGSAGNAGTFTGGLPSIRTAGANVGGGAPSPTPPEQNVSISVTGGDGIGSLLLDVLNIEIDRGASLAGTGG